MANRSYEPCATFGFAKSGRYLIDSWGFSHVMNCSRCANPAEEFRAFEALRPDAKCYAYMCRLGGDDQRKC